MATYPTTLPEIHSIAHKNIKKQHITESAAGYVMSRGRGTVAKKAFDIGYTAMSNTQRDTLQTFFNDNIGDSFDWTHPETGGATYDVVFLEDELSFEWIGLDNWSISFSIREV